MTAIKDSANSSLGTIQYNGYTFGPFFSVKASVAPVMDEAGRSRIASAVRIDLHGVVHGSQAGVSSVATQQQRMTSLVAALQEPRGRLVIKDTGFHSDFDSSLNPDVMLGPKPSVISCTPVGADQAWEVQWSVEYTIKAGNYEPVAGVLACNAEVEYATNEEGLVQRSISGHLILANRVNPAGTGMTLNPEQAFDRLVFPKPAWMKRVGTRRKFNAAKNRIDFAVVDEECADDAYPDGMIAADAELQIENNPPGFVNWSVGLSASFTVAPGLPKSLALDKFFVMLAQAAAKAQAAAAGAGGVAIPERLRITAPKFSRRPRFFASWRLIACLHDLVGKAGLWDPVPGTSYANWSGSLDRAGVTDPRGVSKLRHGGETVVDVGKSALKIPIYNDSGNKNVASESPSKQLLCPPVTEERSYLSWRNKIRAAKSQGVVVHKLMQLVSAALAPPAVSAGLTMLFPQQDTGVEDDVVHYTTKSEDLVVMQGSAMRLKFAPEVPRLEKVGGEAVEELAREIETEPVTGYFDCPLIRTRWAILYRVKGQLYGIKPPRNKKICFAEGENDNVKSNGGVGGGQ